MTEPQLTLERRWIDHYLVGTELLHRLSGHDPNVTPGNPPTVNTLIDLLNDVASGRYVSSKYFRAGRPREASLVTQAPPLAPRTQYALLGLNASTATGQFVSVDEGGIAFEDPVWAILAAQALSKRLSFALPVATNNDELWKNLPAARDRVRNGSYEARRYFAAILGFIPTGSPAKFELLMADSGQVGPLRNRGLQTLEGAVQPRFYQLFSPDPR
jgi:hypothetical protein